MPEKPYKLTVIFSRHTNTDENSFHASEASAMQRLRRMKKHYQYQKSAISVNDDGTWVPVYLDGLWG